jgi:nucleotide-binding universal stress UspA family protein
VKGAAPAGEREGRTHMPCNAICCAVDFEAPSRAALDEAVDLATRLGAELTVLHVVAPPAAAASDVLVGSRELSRIEAEREEELLESWRAGAEERAGRPVQAHLLQGDPATQVLRHARTSRCDLVVIGTHGRTGLTRLVMGSVAEAVAREARCPVLVVHDHGRAEESALVEELAQYH